jgi:hypothetical protein
VGIKTAMLSDWDYANISNVQIGEKNLSLSFKKDEKKTTYIIEQADN